MKHLFIIIPLFFVITVYSQKVSDSHSIYKKIDSLEQKIDTLNTIINDANDLYDKAGLTYDTARNVFEMKASLVTWAIAILTLLSIIGGFVGWQSIKNYIKNNIDRQIKNSISNEIKEHAGLISDLLKKHGKEAELLKSSKILIVNKVGTTTDNKFEMVLKRFEKVNLDVINVEEAEFNSISTDLKNRQTSIENYDAVIIDNIDENDQPNIWDFNHSDELKKKLVKLANSVCKANNVFLFFGDNDGKFAMDIDKEYRHLINFSKNPATLFANLIDLLDFRRLIKK